MNNKEKEYREELIQNLTDYEDEDLDVFIEQCLYEKDEIKQKRKQLSKDMKGIDFDLAIAKEMKIGR